MDVIKQYAKGIHLGLSMKFGKGLMYIGTDQRLRAEALPWMALKGKILEK